MQRPGDAAFPSLAEALARGNAFFSANPTPFPPAPPAAAISALCAAAAALPAPTPIRSDAYAPSRMDHGARLFAVLVQPAEGVWLPTKASTRPPEAPILSQYDTESELSDDSVQDSDIPAVICATAECMASPAAGGWRSVRQPRRSILRRRADDSPLLSGAALVHNDSSSDVDSGHGDADHGDAGNVDAENDSVVPGALVFGYESEITGSPGSRRASIISRFSDFGGAATVAADGIFPSSAENAPALTDMTAAPASGILRRVSIAPVHIADDAEMYDADCDYDDDGHDDDGHDDDGHDDDGHNDDGRNDDSRYSIGHDDDCHADSVVGAGDEKLTMRLPSPVAMRSPVPEKHFSARGDDSGVDIPVNDPTMADENAMENCSRDHGGNNIIGNGSAVRHDEGEPIPLPPSAPVHEWYGPSRKPFAVIDSNQLANVNIAPDESLRAVSKKGMNRAGARSAKTSRPRSRPRGNHGEGGAARQWRELQHLDVARARKAMAQSEGASEDQLSVRKSKRQRFPVLKYWKNETILYERRKSQIMPTIAEITISAPSEEEDSGEEGRDGDVVEDARRGSGSGKNDRGRGKVGKGTGGRAPKRRRGIETEAHGAARVEKATITE
jgi:hypothetical protein